MYPIIYDVSNKYYLRNVLKERTFREIVEELDRTGVCKS